MFPLRFLQKVAVCIIAFALFSVGALADEIGQKFNDMLVSRCQEALAAKSTFLKDKRSPHWIACFVRLENAKLTILAAVAAPVDQLGAKATLTAVSAIGEIRVENLSVIKDGEKYRSSGECKFIEFGDTPESRVTGTSRIDYPLSMGQALSPTATREGGKSSLNGTGLVIMLQ